MAQTVDSVLGADDAIRGQIRENGKGKLTPPTSIIQTVQGARALYFTYRSEHMKRIQLYAMIEGMLSGNPPYSPRDLQNAKLSHISNFNTLDGRAIYEKGSLAYWNLLYETEMLIKFVINGNQDPLSIAHADTMSRHWTDIVREWDSFYTLVNSLTAQIVKFGISPAIWPDERDWKWRVIELSKFYVADQAQCDIGQMTAVCVETTFTAQYLFEVYNQFKDSPKEDTPWNVEELAKLLLWRANSWAKTDAQFIDVMDLQMRIQNGDIGYNAIFSDDIRIVSLINKEYDGKFSHYMFERYFDHGDFLFRADRQYKCLEEFLVLFTASPGEFTIHSNRGLGHKIFAPIQAMMQLDCSVVDMAKIASTPFIKSPATGGKDFEAIRIYPGVPTNIGMAEFVQTNFGANAEQLIAVSQYMGQKVNRNAAIAGDDPSVQDNNVGSVAPQQARIQAYREFGLPKNNVSHFYSQFDRVVKNMTIKMLNSKNGYPGYEEAQEWKRRCIEDGVPEEVFNTRDSDIYGMPKGLRCRASRVAGDGSTLARIMGLQELQPIAGTFGPKAAKEYKREWIMATMGPEYVNAFTQDDRDPDETSGGASLAGVENAVMQLGQSPVFSPDNEQQAHFSTHLALGEHVLQMLQQSQTDPVAADKIFSVLIPHMELHYKTLEGNPFAAQYVLGVKNPWDQLQQEAHFNRKNAVSMIEASIRKQQENQAATQNVMTDAQRKDFVAQSDAKRKDMESQVKLERGKEASDTRGQIQKQSAKDSADNVRLKTELEHEAKMAVPKEKEDQTLAETPLPELQTELQGITGRTPGPYDFE